MLHMTLSKFSARSFAISALVLCASATFAATPAPAKPALVTVAAPVAVVAKPVAAVTASTAPLSSVSLASAVTACKSLALNASCSFKDTKGEVTGLCYTARDKAKACMPLQKAK
jgi:hypothetical protein